MKQNLMRLRHGQLVMATIKNIMEDILRSLPEFIYKYYQGDEMRKIENMIVNARSKVLKIFYIFFYVIIFIK